MKIHVGTSILALCLSFPMLAQAEGRLDPKAVDLKLPTSVIWVKAPNGQEVATLVGDPSKPGLYVQLIKWPPGTGSRPHFHNSDRHITVISGTWWKGTGPVYDAASMVPAPAGSFVVDIAEKIHYDQARDETTIVEIVGIGPVVTTAAEQK